MADDCGQNFNSPWPRPLLHLRAVQRIPVPETSPSPAAGQAKLRALAVEMHGLVRRFGQMEALAKVSLAIRQGEFFSLLGPSGCGKTTLLRIIAGLDLPDAGSLRISGKDVAHIPAHKRPVNTVFQSYALFPHLTVRDNVAFGLRMARVPAAEIAGRVKRVMALVQIAELSERQPAQLSGGQKQRVALARALVNEPEVLLLDEPLGALDLKLRKQLQVELQQLQRRLGITFIHVTHDQDEALVMSDRIAVMNAGRIEQLDNAESLYERPRTRFVAQFLGSCNLLEAEVNSINARGFAARTRVGMLLVAMPLTPPDGERIPREKISRLEPLNPRAVSGSAGTLAGEKFHGQLAGKGAGAPGFMERVSAGRVRGNSDCLLSDEVWPPNPGDNVTLAIRPEKISLSKQSEGTDSNCISARIENLVYSGAETQYRLRANDYSLNAVALNVCVGHQGFHIGDTVVCSLPEQALIVLDD